MTTRKEVTGLKTSDLKKRYELLREIEAFGKLNKWPNFLRDVVLGDTGSFTQTSYPWNFPGFIWIDGSRYKAALQPHSIFSRSGHLRLVASPFPVRSGSQPRKGYIILVNSEGIIESVRLNCPTAL